MKSALSLMLQRSCVTFGPQESQTLQPCVCCKGVPSWNNQVIAFSWNLLGMEGYQVSCHQDQPSNAGLLLSKLESTWDQRSLTCVAVTRQREKKRAVQRPSALVSSQMVPIEVLWHREAIFLVFLHDHFPVRSWELRSLGRNAIAQFLALGLLCNHSLTSLRAHLAGSLGHRG